MSIVYDQGSEGSDTNFCQCLKKKYHKAQEKIKMPLKKKKKN